MLRFKQKGSFKNTERFLTAMKKRSIFSVLKEYGQMGVDALSAATPEDTGLTKTLWDFQISVKDGRVSIIWTNSGTAGDAPTVILLQYGHGTGTGGYVQGQDFINPAIAPVFDKISDGVWKEVQNA